jgi:ATP-dependent DNA ligase
MPLASGFIPPCVPTRTAQPPAGPDWVHEVKHDGYRLQVRRDGDAVRLFTRRGYDWSGRYPAIAVTATLLRASTSHCRTRGVADARFGSSRRDLGLALLQTT